MSIRGNTSGEFFGEWFGPVEVVPGAMFANLTGAGSMAGNLAAAVAQQTLGGVHAAWDSTRGLTPELRAKIRKQLEEEIAEPVREAIAAQSKTRFESMEAEERAIRAATEAAQIEYQALYLRLLAYQREEMLMEEEAIVMTMFAALSR